jgi:hypothetical protein
LKKIAILLISAAVFTFSILSRAEGISRDLIAPIKTIQYDAESMILKITGNLPNRCTAAPRPSLSLMNSDQKVLLLQVVATTTSEFCIDILGSPYELAFDIRSLKHNLIELNINPNEEYVIITKSGWSETINFEEVPFNKSFATMKIAGGVFEVENGGKYVVVVDDEQAFVVKSTAINLDMYVGAEVEVQGHVLNKRTPGTSFGSNDEKPLFLVTGINTTSH